LPSQISSSSEIPRIFGKLYRDPTQRNFLKFLDKFLWGMLFLTSSSFQPYFLWNFWRQLGPPFDRISLNYFKLIQINAKPYCSSGLGHPAFFSDRPTRARAPPAPPRSHCHRGLPGRRQRAAARTAMRRPCASHPGRGRPGHGRGAAHRSGPGPTTSSRTASHFRGRTPPPLSFLSPSVAPTIAPLKRDRTHSFSRLHSSSTPPLEHPSLPTTPRTRTAASDHRQPTLPRGF
jgi:hypothetical protein